MMTAMTEDPKGEELSLAFARLATYGAKVFKDLKIGEYYDILVRVTTRKCV